MTTLKLFRVTVKAPIGARVNDYVDWYDAEDIKAAEEEAREDMHRYGIPQDSPFEIVECNRETLKPFNAIPSGINIGAWRF